MTLIKTKDVRSVAGSLDNIVKYYKDVYNPEKNKPKRDWQTYEQDVSNRMTMAAIDLKQRVHEAAEVIMVMDKDVEEKKKGGRKPILTPEERALLLLLKEIFQLTNRKMAAYMLLFSVMTGKFVSYKTVERLYSDELVQLIIHNMFVRMIKEKKIDNADCCGDGSGYSLSIKKHYRDSKDTEKKHKDFVYYFALLDLDSFMYIAYGYSRRSEKDAYNKALDVLEELGINVKTVRLDKYYSNECLMYDFAKDVVFYIIPKTNVTVEGCVKWKKTLGRFVSDTYVYLMEYFKRNMSESMNSFDKRTFGGFVRQKLDERISTCLSARTTLHNMFWFYG